VAAIRAAQLGLNTACIEREPVLGGTCLRVGCIPSKALLESSERFAEAAGDGLKGHGVALGSVALDLPAMLKRKDGVVRQLTKGIDGLFKKNGITRYTGTGRIAAPGRVAVDGDQPAEFQAKHILIATGSAPASLPGIQLDGDRVGTSTEALSYPEVPEHLVVIGAGYIGLELGSVWRRLGAKVTVLEYLPRILPGMDDDMAKAARKLFEKQGLTFHLGAKVTGVERDGDRCSVAVEGGDPVACDRVLVSVGRVPVTKGLGLDAAGIQPDPRGRIVVDEHYRTSAEGVYAIGDVISFADWAPPMLAHKAEEEGVACVEQLVTGYGHVNYDAIPAVCYTHPEIASVGKTEAQLKEAGTPYRAGSFPFMANGRAKALGETDGQVKVLAHEKTDRVLGVHILGPRAGDLIAEAAVAMEYGASSEDIARACHAHPTLAEAVKEAALAVDGRPIHF
jgi:dihydrolipoamide dehydrogenase